jgi:EAL domain-containing protein (putative c-di-GMP-specific phosphodiesterase class I)
MQQGERLLGAEALLRWHHPQRGVLAAAEFLRFVEEAELLADVDLATAERLAMELSRLDRAGRRVDRLWLNVSVSELFSDQFLEEVASVAERAGLGRRRMGLEVPGVVFSIDETPVKRRLAMARRLGVAVAVDHFGPGLSPRYAWGEPVDVIKVDRSLIERVDHAIPPWRVVAAIVELAHSSGATVVVQGVERSSQVGIIRDLGCDGAQGYFFGKPVPIGELAGVTGPELPACTWWG